MKILLTNTDKLTSAIKEAEGRATARTETADHIARVLNRIKVPKAHLDGTKVYYDNGEKFAKAYKYTPESTHWTAENVKGKWYITDIHRDRCPNRFQSGNIVFGDPAKAWIISNASKL